MHRRRRGRSRFALAALIACVRRARRRRAGRDGGLRRDERRGRPGERPAGANSDFSIAFDLGPADRSKDLVIHLPPGLVGNPLATTTCNEQQLKADDCPAASDGRHDHERRDECRRLRAPDRQRATSTTSSRAPVSRRDSGSSSTLRQPTRSSCSRPPRCGRATSASTRPSTNLPQNATVAGLPTPITITGVQLTLKGQVGSPAKGFLRNPTSCGTHTVAIDATAYDGRPATGRTPSTRRTARRSRSRPQFSAEIHQTGPTQQAGRGLDHDRADDRRGGAQARRRDAPARARAERDGAQQHCAEADFTAQQLPRRFDRRQRAGGLAAPGGSADRSRRPDHTPDRKPAGARSGPPGRACAEAPGCDRDRRYEPRRASQPGHLRRAARHPDQRLHPHVRRRPRRHQPRHPRFLHPAGAQLRHDLRFALRPRPPAGRRTPRPPARGRAASGRARG